MPAIETHPHELGPGVAVEVRNRFDGRWARGFEVVAHGPEGFRIRRISDGQELPTLFAPREVRPPGERRAARWWS
jgi:hypothetical protein